ncbi:hypothetical protein [Nocardia wallacei]|nr:hypothetical protein [Nocardia wallacei]
MFLRFLNLLDSLPGDLLLPLALIVILVLISVALTASMAALV